MSRRYTGAEARELRRGVGPFEVSGVVIVNAHPAAAIRCVADINDQTLGPLLAAAPDLAESLAAVEAERDALRAKLHDAHVALAATAMGSDTTRTTIRDYLKALDEYNEIGDGAVVAEYEYALSTLREAAK